MRRTRGLTWDEVSASLLAEAPGGTAWGAAPKATWEVGLLLPPGPELEEGDKFGNFQSKFPQASPPQPHTLLPGPRGRLRGTDSCGTGWDKAGGLPGGDSALDPGPGSPGA